MVSSLGNFPDGITAAIGALGQILMAGAAVAGAVAAYMGLNTWKHQSRYDRDSGLARRLLLSLYRYREAIIALRSPFIFSSEAPERMTEEDKWSHGDKNRFLSNARVYERRWKSVASTRSELHAVLLEADATWGSELRNRFNRLFDLQAELNIEVSNSLDASDPALPEFQRRSAQEALRKSRTVMYELSSERDEFSREFGSVVKEIEDFLRPKVDAKS